MFPRCNRESRNCQGEYYCIQDNEYIVPGPKRQLHQSTLNFLNIT